MNKHNFWKNENAPYHVLHILDKETGFYNITITTFSSTFLTLNCSKGGYNRKS